MIPRRVRYPTQVSRARATLLPAKSAGKKRGENKRGEMKGNTNGTLGQSLPEIPDEGEENDGLFR